MIQRELFITTSEETLQNLGKVLNEALDEGQNIQFIIGEVIIAFLHRMNTDSGEREVVVNIMGPQDKAVRARDLFLKAFPEFYLFSRED